MTKSAVLEPDTDEIRHDHETDREALPDQAPRRPGRLSRPSWRRAVVRLATVIADYALAMATATVVVPLVGVFLYNLGGASTTGNASAQITFWLAPFLLLVLLLAAGDIVAMAALWRFGTRIIERSRTDHTGSDVVDDTATTTTSDCPARRRKNSGSSRKS